MCQENSRTHDWVGSCPRHVCTKSYAPTAIKHRKTGRKLGVRLQEHRTEVESKTKRAFIRSQRSSTSAEYNKSALTDHALQENHMILINWVHAFGDRQGTRQTHQQCWGRVNSNEFNSRVNSFTVSYEFELTHSINCELWVWFNSYFVWVWVKIAILKTQFADRQLSLKSIDIKKSEQCCCQTQLNRTEWYFARAAFC